MSLFSSSLTIEIVHTMGIPEILDTLKQAQGLDREIHRIRQEIDSIPESIHELTQAFEAEKSRLDHLENQLKEVQLRQKKKEGELGEKEALIRKYDSQSTQVKTNKEYSALQQEIASLKADGSMLEDEILGILDEMENVQKQVREERNRLAQLETESQGKKKQLTDKAETIKKNLAGLIEKRLEIIKQVSPEARELYDKIIKKKEGLALVPVIGDACGACRMELRPQVLNEVRLKEALVVCDNCSRILYID